MATCALVCTLAGLDWLVLQHIPAGTASCPILVLAAAAAAVTVRIAALSAWPQSKVAMLRTEG